MGETAIKVAAKLVLHKMWVASSGLVPPPGVVKKCLEIIAHHRIQGSFFRLTAAMAKRKRLQGSTWLPLVANVRTLSMDGLRNVA